MSEIIGMIQYVTLQLVSSGYQLLFQLLNQYELAQTV